MPSYGVFPGVHGYDMFPGAPGFGKREDNTEDNTSEWLKKELMGRYENERYDGFLPDRGVYDQYIDTSVEEIMAGLPVAEEQYEADLASRGIRSSGEATKYKYQQVYAPVAREAAAVATKANLAYAEAYQRGQITAQQFRAESLRTLVDYILKTKEMDLQAAAIKGQNTSSLIEGVFDVVTSVIPFL